MEKLSESLIVIVISLFFTQSLPDLGTLQKSVHFKVGLYFVYYHQSMESCDNHEIAQSVLFNDNQGHGRAEKLESVQICARVEDSGRVFQHRSVLLCSSLEETCRLCVFTGEELCSERKQGCTLDCPFGFLTDAQNCEICECRPRPKKCRPIICDKYCPLGLLYVFLNSEKLL